MVMADSNLPKQDFAPPWLKFPSEAKASGQKSNDRNRQRRDEPYYPRADFGRLHRQNSFDFPDGKHYPQGPNKYRHHSVDDDYFGYSYGGYGGGYYQPNYNNYEKFGMHYSSQPSLARNMGREGKYPGNRFNQFNGCIPTNGPHHDLFEPYYQQSTPKRNHHHRDSRNNDSKSAADRGGSDKDRHYSDDFPSLNGSGDSPAESKPTKTGSGVWDNPPKSNNRNEESSDSTKANSPGIYKALIPNKNGQNKKNAKDTPKVNGNARDSSPLSPSTKLNHKEATTRQSPTPDLAIVTQPKKLGDKKSDFLRALRNETSVRNGEVCHNLNQNSAEKKMDSKSSDSPMGEENDNFDPMNNSGTGCLDSNKNLLNGKSDIFVNGMDSCCNGEALINDVDQISLSGEDEEKRLLLSMGWVEEDNEEYVITEDEIREFQKLHGLKKSPGSALNKKLNVNGMLNGIPDEEEEETDNSKHL